MLADFLSLPYPSVQPHHLQKHTEHNCFCSIGASTESPGNFWSDMQSHISSTTSSGNLPPPPKRKPGLPLMNSAISLGAHLTHTWRLLRANYELNNPSVTPCHRPHPPHVGRILGRQRQSTAPVQHALRTHAPRSPVRVSGHDIGRATCALHDAQLHVSSRAPSSTRTGTRWS